MTTSTTFNFTDELSRNCQDGILTIKRSDGPLFHHLWILDYTLLLYLYVTSKYSTCFVESYWVNLKLRIRGGLMALWSAEERCLFSSLQCCCLLYSIIYQTRVMTSKIENARFVFILFRRLAKFLDLEQNKNTTIPNNKYHITSKTKSITWLPFITPIHEPLFSQCNCNRPKPKS